jgi:hypothetical protein
MLLLNDATSSPGRSQPPEYNTDGDSTAAEQMDETDNDDEEYVQETPAHEIGVFRYRSPTDVRSATTSLSEAAQLTSGYHRTNVSDIDTSLETIRQAVSTDNLRPSSRSEPTSWLDSPAVTPSGDTADTTRTLRPEGWWSGTNSAMSSTPALERHHLFQ